MAMKFEKTGDGTYTLDVCGYTCPHPQLYTKKSLEKMAEGEILEVIFDNPSSQESITQMCNAEGHEVVESTQDGSRFVIKIEKG